MWERSVNNKKVSSTYLLYKAGLKSKRQFWSHRVSWKQRKILAKEGPNGLPIATPSICRYNLSLKWNRVFLTDNPRNVLNWVMERERKELLSEYKELAAMSIVSSSGMFVKSDFMSKIAITKLSEFWKQEISWAKVKESLTANSLVVSFSR